MSAKKRFKVVRNEGFYNIFDAENKEYLLYKHPFIIEPVPIEFTVSTAAEYVVNLLNEMNDKANAR